MNPLKKIAYGLLKKMKFLPPVFYVKIYYEYYTGKKMNVKAPRDFNEKIQWIKVFYKPDILTRLADKLEVRNYVRDKIGEQYLNTLLAVYKHADEIVLDALPEQFVLKGTHGCNYNLIVKDKNKITLRRVKRLMRKWLGRNYYYRSGLEWAYKNIPPRVIAEAYMKEEGKDVLNDYKLYCFDGKVKFIHVDIDRNTEKYNRCFYDLEWKKLPFNRGQKSIFEGEVKKPENLREMITLAETLADTFPFVRVDFFSVNGKSVFGEMTFYPGDGRMEFYPEEYNSIIGDYLKLPGLKKGEKYIKTI